MRLGVEYPSHELAGDPKALREYAKAAEDLGYDHLVLNDHPIGVSPENRDVPLVYDEKDAFHDPLVAFAYLAGITNRIEFVPAILVLPQRQTVLVARQTADVDLMSGGRLRLGVAPGYSPYEFHALGADFKTRGKRLDEQIPYLRRLWAEELITFDGRFDQIDRGNIVPRPERRIPIWVGGFSEPAFRRAAVLGDGFMFGYGLEQEARRCWIRVQELLAEQQRPAADFGAEFLLRPPEGTLYSDREIVDGVRELEEAGATHVAICAIGRGLAGVSAHIDYIASLKRLFEKAG